MRNLDNSLKKVPKQRYDVLKSDNGLSDHSSTEVAPEKRISKMSNGNHTDQKSDPDDQFNKSPSKFILPPINPNKSSHKNVKETMMAWQEVDD